jgi:diadenosine tetraphosphate (Ap4A) HIT family hydrolase
MLEKIFPLSSKMRINADYEKLENFSQKHIQFYLKYSSFVFRALKKVLFQKFLNWMLKKEKIEVHAVRAVHVKVLPLRRKNGKGIAGKCDTARGRIQIYPKTMKFCQVFKHKFGRNSFLFYAGNRARAALIHELLHLKYSADEKTVRELAQDYFFIFTRKQPAQSSKALTIYKMIFNAKVSGNKAPPSGSTESNMRLELN